jgi:hypothetical protein
VPAPGTNNASYLSSLVRSQRASGTYCDPGSSVRAVFSWSYRQLSDEAARMFRLLGLHPGRDITAAVCGLAVATADDERKALNVTPRQLLVAGDLGSAALLYPPPRAPSLGLSK